MQRYSDLCKALDESELHSEWHYFRKSGEFCLVLGFTAMAVHRR